MPEAVEKIENLQPTDPDGLRLTLEPNPKVMISLAAETAARMRVLPICKVGRCTVVLTEGALSEVEAAQLQKALGGPIYTLPGAIVECSSLLNQAVRQSAEFADFARELADHGHFLAAKLPTDANSGRQPIAKILRRLGLLASGELGDGEDSRLFSSLFVDTSVLRLLEPERSKNEQLLPLKLDNGMLWLAAAVRPSQAVIDELSEASHAEVRVLLAEPSELQEAIEECYRRVTQLGFQQMRLGEILLARGVVSHQQLETALDEQKKSGLKLGEILVRRGFASEEIIYSALAEKLGFEYQNFNYLEVDRRASRVISRRFAESHQVLPCKLDDATKTLMVAMANPQDLAVLDLLKKLCKQKEYRLKPLISTPSQIEQAIAYVYNSDGLDTNDPEIETVVSDDQDRSDLVLSSEMPQIKKILNQLLYQAVIDGASDIHIENLESRVRVRFRIDGILQLRETLISKENIGQVTSVLKIDSNLDITERRRPQDGVFKKRIGKDWYIDFRINVHSTPFGPDAVIRILDSSKKLPKLDQLGLPDEILEAYLKLVQNPQGMILITGPTGSGKSTTLYSTLRFLNRAECKIVTAEDPIEYHLDGINQYQVNEEIGNSFAEYGRRFLRKDPDIILIGETRDETTAESCLRAAMTGHLVFSTLHTNHSTAAVARLVDLGVDASSICDALLAVVAQRLVRRNCEGCTEIYDPDRTVLEEFFGEALPEKLEFQRGRGCPSCNHTGYRGRIGLYEFWELDRETRYAILGGASERQLQELARESGLRPLMEDALRKVERGITTLDELRRVVPLEQIRANAARLEGRKSRGRHLESV